MRFQGKTLFLHFLFRGEKSINAEMGRNAENNADSMEDYQ